METGLSFSPKATGMSSSLKKKFTPLTLNKVCMIIRTIKFVVYIHIATISFRNLNTFFKQSDTQFVPALKHRMLALPFVAYAVNLAPRSDEPDL